ncbi:hypothetical protein GCM10022393_02220 [Aquimarina addita]|uniref:Thioredoxin domain-containing protein n=1 Tax=Aquimarina addita TaxID=870485 RepID=A0ABP7XAP5_9FLAO
MKKLLLVLLLILLGTNSINAQEWFTDIEMAKKTASDESKPIILVFAGSDWCAPCIKLEKEILETTQFKKYAREKYVLLKADFPRKKKNQLSESLQQHNKQLAEAYNKSGGFPLVVVLDKNGKKIGETGYKKMTPEAYIQVLNSMIK